MCQSSNFCHGVRLLHNVKYSISALAFSIDHWHLLHLRLLMSDPANPLPLYKESNTLHSSLPLVVVDTTRSVPPKYKFAVVIWSRHLVPLQPPTGARYRTSIHHNICAKFLKPVFHQN